MKTVTSFDQSEYQEHRFERLRLPSESIKQKAFYECTFDHCLFSEAQFQSCRFFDCVFKNCDLSLLGVMGCTFVSTRFEHSKVIGINWTNASWNSISPRKIDFYASDISYSTFMQLKLIGMQLENCKAHEVDFAETDLSEARCAASDFTQARFLHTNLTKADFSGASNYTISPLLNTLKGAIFSLPEAMSLLRHFEIELRDS